MRIAITGATGFIGKALLKALQERGDSVVAFSRNSARAKAQLGPSVECVEWDAVAETVGPWRDALKGCDALVHLAGESINGGRWTESFKHTLRSSRIQSTKLLVQALGQLAEGERPKVFVSSSGADFYGDTGERAMSEADANGTTFLAKLCLDWEAEALPARALGLRVVLARTSVVLGDKGGALEKMIPAFKLFFGGPIASGKQYFPWIHAEDMTRALIALIDDARYDGPVNMVAQSVPMKEFSRTLGAVLSRPSWFPVPKFLLQIGLGELGTMLAESKRLVPATLLNNGFVFRYPELEPALRAVVS